MKKTPIQESIDVQLAELRAAVESGEVKQTELLRNSELQMTASMLQRVVRGTITTPIGDKMIKSLHAALKHIRAVRWYWSLKAAIECEEVDYGLLGAEVGRDRKYARRVLVESEGYPYSELRNLHEALSAIRDAREHSDRWACQRSSVKEAIDDYIERREKEAA